MNPLLMLSEHGQSYWLDNLTRDMITNGELARRVARTGLRGVTSNPSIFHKAITGGDSYDGQIREAHEKQLPLHGIYEELVTQDIRDACDVLRDVYNETEGSDGYVSLEISPHLAHRTHASVEEARRLWAKVDRPNLLIKIPGTAEGLPCVEALLAEGINVNITLLFSVNRYQEVAEVYLRALERRVDAGLPVRGIASVASFFLSRIDTQVDALLSHRIAPGTARPRPDPASLQGMAAIASAKIAYQRFRDVLNSARWKALAERGARPQRLLWASTGTKNPRYSDVMYVEPLIGPHTVNTMPSQTVDAFADHGTVKDTLEDGLDQVEAVLMALRDTGIDLDLVAEQLLSDGVQKFIEPFDALLNAIGEKSKHAETNTDVAR